MEEDPNKILVKTFAYHKPSPDALKRINKLRLEYSRLTRLIAELTPKGSREQSLAITNLETSAMWAIKDVVCNDPESIVEPL